MTANDMIQEIDQNIREAQKIIDLGECLERLQINRDFKKVIQEGYFEKEAVRLVHLKADPAMQTKEYQESILKQMDAIGALNQYFETVFRNANQARKAVAYDEEAREEILAGEEA